MLVEKYLFYLRLLVILFAVATEGKKRKKNKKSESLADEPVITEEEIANLCDIKSPNIIYCYCNTIDWDQAEEGNCWIFNDTSDDKYKDVWEGFSTQTNIKHLTLHLRPDGTLKKIPTIAIQHLPDLNKFEVQYATIHTVHSQCFANSSSVEKISLARNGIHVLEPYSFSNLASVRSISLGENQLTDIKRSVFTQLPKLTQLFLDRNNISSIEDNAFAELKNLVELEMFSNKIQAIVPETFAGLRSLERLDLHKNWIEVLGDNTFQHLKSLQYLDLMGNSLKYIAPRSFYGLNKMQSLVLQDNKLLSLGSEVFKYTTGLMNLDLQQNVLETVTEDTIHPLWTNLKKENMRIHLEGNIFRCDTRLSWMFSLYNTTKSRSVRMSLEEVSCYLESGTLPPRLEGVDTTPLYEITTLGIGPRTELLKLHPSELPDPLIRTPATFTQEEDCEHDEEKELSSKSKPRGRGNKGKGKGKKHHHSATHQHNMAATTAIDSQNDMAPPNPSKQKGREGKETSTDVRHTMRPAPPAQESRSFNDPTSPADKITASSVYISGIFIFTSLFCNYYSLG